MIIEPKNESSKLYKLVNKVPVELALDEDTSCVFSHSNQDERTVGKAWINDFCIITEFTGVDQSSNENANPPEVFLTLISHEYLDLDYVAETYATWEEAEKGFNKCFSKIKSLTNSNLNLNQMKMLFNDY